MEGVIDTLIAATLASELDRFVEASNAIEGRGLPKVKKPTDAVLFQAIKSRALTPTEYLPEVKRS